MATPQRAAVVRHAGHDGLGESPVWNIPQSTLLWLDIRSALLHSLDDRNGQVFTRRVPSESTCVVLTEDGHPVVASPSGVHLITAEEMVLLADPWLHDETHRTNDGAVDPSGRLWVGSMRRDRAQGTGTLGWIRGRGHVPMISGLTLPNGIAWDSTGTVMFYVDTGTNTIWRAGFVSGTPDVVDPVPWVQWPASNGLLDGIAVDEEGGVWAGLWDGSAVVRFNAHGQMDDLVQVDTPRVTSCAFGGTRMETLFITTAVSPNSVSRTGGSLFSIDLGLEGLRPHPMRF